MKNQLAQMPCWCIFRRISSGYHICIAKHNSRAESERAFALLKTLMPEASLQMAFSTEDTYKLENSVPTVTG